MRYSFNLDIRAVFRFLALFLFLVFAVAPLYWIIVTSLKSPREIYAWPLQYWPEQPSFESYGKLLSLSRFGQYFRNSLFLSVFGALLTIVISIPSGFAMSRFKSAKNKRRFLLTFYFTQTIPTFLLIIPIYTIFAKLKLLDNLASLGLLYVTLSLAFATIMAKSFFDRIPSTLEEAALIDGCNTLSALFRIIVPVTLPGIAAIFSFTFINIWNELFLAVMLLSTSSKMTVPVALNSFISKAGVSWDILSAGIVVALLPTMIVFGIGQRFIVAGLTEGSVKG